MNIFKNKLFTSGLIIAFFVALIDLASKRIIFSILENIAITQNTINPRIIILDFFNIIYVVNNGVSFGMFNNIANAQIILSILQFLIAVIISIWLFNNKNKNLVLPLGLIIGGALGNVIDRVKNGGVSDFLDFHIANYHWPAFNIADSCVFIGVVIIIFNDLFTKKDK